MARQAAPCTHCRKTRPKGMGLETLPRWEILVWPHVGPNLHLCRPCAELPEYRLLQRLEREA